MLKFDIDVQAADESRREITGLAVPFGETAQLNGREYRFEPGSLRAARRRTPLLLGHDTNQPVGILASLEDTDAGVRATFRVDEGPVGDQALAQARSGSRGGLSIGAEIVSAIEDEDGVHVVAEAALFETSLVAIPAFASAEVEHVTAEADTDNPNTENPMQENPTTEPADEPVADDDTVAAAAPVRVIAERPKPMPTLDEYVMATVRAAHGDRAAAEIVRAAAPTPLQPGNTTEVPGILPPAYVNELIGRFPDNRPVANTIRRLNLPPHGTSVLRPLLAMGPQPAVAATLDDPATSSPVSIGEIKLDIHRWDWAGAASIAVIERSNIDYVSLVLGEALAKMHDELEHRLTAGMAATVATGGATHTATTIGAAVGKVYKNRKLPADAILCGPEFYGALLDARGSATFSSGSVSKDLTGNVYGLKAVCTPYMDANKALVIRSQDIELWESNPVRLTANAIGAMQLEFGVVGFFAMMVENMSVCEVTALPTKTTR